MLFEIWVCIRFCSWMFWVSSVLWLLKHQRFKVCGVGLRFEILHCWAGRNSIIMRGIKGCTIYLQ